MAAMTTVMSVLRGMYAAEAEDGRIVEVHPFYWDTAAVAAACSPA